MPPFEIIPINPDEDPEKWAMAWPDLNDGHTPEDQTSVAYKPVRVAGGINVYYSTIFTPLREQMERLIAASSSLAATFRTNYEIWIGYHAILQESSKDAKMPPIEDQVFEKLQEEERIRVARMQIKQAMRMTELTKDLIESQKAAAIST